MASDLQALIAQLEQLWVPDGDTVLMPSSVGLTALASETGIGATRTDDQGFPASPQDGDRQTMFVDSGVIWTFEANAGEWYFIGGPPLYAEVVTSQAVSSTTYVDLATAGPSLTVPFAGDYVIEGGAAGSTGASVNHYTFGSVKFGAAATSDADFLYQKAGVSGATFGNVDTQMRRYEKTGLTAGEVLKMQYRKVGVSANCNFSQRWLSITPIKVT